MLKKNQLLFCLILVFISLTIKAQTCVTIDGLVKDQNQYLLQSVIVNVKIGEKNYYSITDKLGKYSLKICSTNDSFLLNPLKFTFKLIGFKETNSISRIKLGSNILKDIVLELSEQVLKEVIVQNKPVIQKGDTTVFTIGSFKDKTDGNLEDVLKKMPGFDIDDNGRILYNNKPIETILIEGDELAKNYKLISKNIPPDALDKLELIDNYESNPLMKGLSGKRKQAINLTLKNPNHVSTFGSIKTGGGIEDKYNLAGNLFGINKYLKTMVIGNANNIGINPYDEITTDQRTQESQSYEFSQTLIKDLISEDPLFLKPLIRSNTNTLINNSKLAAINFSYKLNSRTTAKLFTDFYGDRIGQHQVTNFINLLSPNASYSTDVQKTFKPRNNNAYFEIKRTSNKERFLLSAVYTVKQYLETDSINSSINYLAELFGTYSRKSLGFYYTNRLDSNHLFELSAQYSKDTKVQDYSIYQNAFRKLTLTDSASAFFQKTGTSVDFLELQAKYIFKKSNKTTNELKIINTYYSSNLGSTLFLQGNSTNFIPYNDFTNDANNSNNKLLLLYTKQYNFKPLTAGGSLGYSFFNFNYHINNNVRQKDNFSLPTANILLRYKLNLKNDISYTIDYNSLNPGINTILENPILSSFRAFTKWMPLNTNIPHFQSNLTYVYRDLDKGSSLIISWLYNRQQMNEISNFKYSPDFDFQTNRLADFKLDQNTLFFKYDQYISRYKTSFNFKQSLTWLSRPLEFNNSILSNRNFIYSLSASLKPYFGSSISLTGGFNLNFNKDLSSDKSTYQAGPFLSANFNISQKLIFGTYINYLTDNFSFYTNKYWFANANLWYIIKPSKIELKCSFNNIINQNSIFTGARNDLFNQFSEQKLLPRFALLEINYKF
ncbi:MAG: hypothetical protein WCP74_12085 [Sphingobacteriia bacterium]|jgi:hypothetical protein